MEEFRDEDEVPSDEGNDDGLDEAGGKSLTLRKCLLLRIISLMKEHM
jgi:hypothetical protein